MRHGDIIVSSEARESQLTFSGHDKEPSLSPDSRWIIFVRENPKRLIDRTTYPGTSAQTDLWVIGIDGKGERRLIAEGARDSKGTIFGDYRVPSFLSDSVHFVFWSEQSAVSGVIGKSDTVSGKITLPGGANSLEVVRGGEYEDHLVVRKHKYFLAGGTYDCYWLIDLNGREIGPVGEEDDSIEMFKEMYASPGQVFTVSASLPGLLLEPRSIDAAVQ